MGQYSLYKNGNRDTKKAYPYFVNVQSDLLDELNSRLVIPFYPHTKHLNKQMLTNFAP